MYLQVPLGLLEGSHDAKCAEEVSLGIRGYAWDDGVVRPLPGPQAVGVLGIQKEVVAAIVQREAAPLWDDACAKFLGLLPGAAGLKDSSLGPRALGCLIVSAPLLPIEPEPFYSE